MSVQDAVRAEAGAQEDTRVLTEAVRRIAEFWNLSNAALGGVLGLSAATVSRLRNGERTLEPGSKSFELAQFLVRLFRGVDALMGSDDEAARSWLRSDNRFLESRPIDLIQRIEGLTRTCHYVDTMRGPS